MHTNHEKQFPWSPSFSVLRRIGYALPFAVLGGYCVKKAIAHQEVFGSMAWLLYAAAMLIVVGVIFAFPIADFIGDYVSRIYFSGGSVVPPPHYLLAERYERETKWDLALAEFEKIVHYHPAELPAHVGRIRLALIGYEDEAMARRFLKHSLGTLQDPNSLTRLQETWSTLSPPPPAKKSDS